MPSYVVERIAEKLNDQKKAVNGSTVLLLGVTYKPNIADQRESPAIPVARELLKRRANVRFHDPFVPVWNIGSGESLTSEQDLQEAVSDADIVVLLQAHSPYDASALQKGSSLFLDTCGIIDEPSDRL